MPKITKKSAKNCPINSLPPGHAFFFEDKLYISAGHHPEFLSDIISVCLSNNKVFTLSEKTVVIPTVISEIIVE
jgi:hypothetical protein